MLTWYLQQKDLTLELPCVSIKQIRSAQSALPTALKKLADMVSIAPPWECFNTIFSQQVFFQNTVMLFPSRSIKPTQKPLVCKNIQTASIPFSANNYSFKIQRCCSPPDQLSLHRNHSSVKIFNIQTASIPFSANKYSLKIQSCCSPPDQISLHRNHSWKKKSLWKYSGIWSEFLQWTMILIRTHQTCDSIK